MRWLFLIMIGFWPAAGSAQSWFQTNGEHAMLLTNCQETDAAPVRVCLMIQCFWEGTFRLHLGLPVTAVPPQSAAVLALDGKPTLQAVFLDNTGFGNPSNFATLIAPDTLIALMDRMARARVLSVKLDAQSLNLPNSVDMPLDGFAAALPLFRGGCVDPMMAELAQPKAPQPKIPAAPAIMAATEANPGTDLKRFVSIDAISDKTEATLALARSKLAAKIAEVEADLGEPIDVFADLVPFQDGRQLLFASLCHASYFGITGCETHLFYSPPGETNLIWQQEWIGGGPYWLDLQSGQNGWPDLISMPHTAKGAYVRSNFANLRF